MRLSAVASVLGTLVVVAMLVTSTSRAQPITGVEEVASLSVPDCDGLAAGDIDGDGDLDLLASASREGRVFWFEQRGSPRRWRRHEVFVAEYDAPKIEGNALGDFNGDGRLEGVSLDQQAARVLLHVRRDDPSRPWQTVALRTDRATLQDALVADLGEDGTPELLYTWEGNRAGRGGIHRLTLTGTDPLSPSQWQDRALVTHESAWWLAPRLFDLNGSGIRRDLVYTARHHLGRNPGSRPGVFWLEAPASDGPWRRHTIDDRLPHPLHVDAGQLTADGPPHDLVVGGFEVSRVYWYDADSWQRHSLDLPPIADTEAERFWNAFATSWLGRDIIPVADTVRRVWNVETVPIPTQRRDAVLAIAEADGESAMVLFQWHGDHYGPTVLKHLPYGHAMEDRILCRDVLGDKMPELIIADSGGGKLRILRFTQSSQ